MSDSEGMEHGLRRVPYSGWSAEAESRFAFLVLIVASNLRSCAAVALQSPAPLFLAVCDGCSPTGFEACGPRGDAQSHSQGDPEGDSQGFEEGEEGEEGEQDREGEACKGRGVQGVEGEDFHRCIVAAADCGVMCCCA